MELSISKNILQNANMSALKNRYERALENFITQNIELYYTNILGEVKDGYPTVRSIGSILGEHLQNVRTDFEKEVVVPAGGYSNINMLDFIEYMLKKLTGDLVIGKSVRKKYADSLQDNEYLKQLIVYLGFRYLELAFDSKSLKSESAYRMMKNWYLLKQAQDGIGKVVGRAVKYGIDNNTQKEFEQYTRQTMKQVLELSKDCFIKTEYEIYLEYKELIEEGIIQMRNQITYKEAV